MYSIKKLVKKFNVVLQNNNNENVNIFNGFLCFVCFLLLLFLFFKNKYKIQYTLVSSHEHKQCGMRVQVPQSIEKEIKIQFIIKHLNTRKRLKGVES